MQKLLSTNFSEEVLSLKPKLPEVTCEYYLTDQSSRQPFYSWIIHYEDVFSRPEEYEWVNDTDKLRYDFLLLPLVVRQAGNLRIFGNSWKYYATRKSLYVAGLAFFKPESTMLSVIYKEAKLRKNREDSKKLRANQFLYQIAKGNFS